MRLTSRWVGMGAMAMMAALAAGAQSLPRAQQTAIDAVFQDFNTRTPGCVVGISEHGRQVFARGYGMASLESATPLTPASVLEIGSVSKQITAASIFLLQQEGKLSLDDPAQRYLPGMPVYAHPLTIRELLHHTSGVRDVIQLMQMSGIRTNDFATMPDALALIERQRALNFPPNTRYLYSNSGYVLLAEIVRRVSGEPLSTFAAQHIFQPLGMRHSQIVLDHRLVIPGRTRTYAPAPGSGWRLEVSPWQQIGDGGVNTTVGDLELWAANFWRPRVGGARLIQQLETQGVLNDGRTIAYAGGLEVDQYRGLQRIAHGGSWQGFRTQFTLFPKPQVAIITLCNVASADPALRSRKVADVILGDQLAPEPVPAATPTLSVAQLRAYAGWYWSAADYDLRQVSVDGAALRLRQWPGPSVRLQPLGQGKFRAAGDTLVFQPLARGMQLRLEATGELLTRQPAASGNAAGTHALVGRYQSPALQVSWTVAQDSKGLLLRAFGANPNRLDTDHSYPVRPAIAGVFIAGPYLLQFDGASLKVSAGRAEGIRFRRVTQ
ncbi:MAG: class A beta-lactamase-related serine hydrolase [Acidobacteria bacterium]|nr:MAG: class A beta-lactamase-related serine hydrolase [Acidobacteriota bacterium]